MINVAHCALMQGGLYCSLSMERERALLGGLGRLSATFVSFLSVLCEITKLEGSW